MRIILNGKDSTQNCIDMKTTWVKKNAKSLLISNAKCTSNAINSFIHLTYVH